MKQIILSLFSSLLLFTFSYAQIEVIDNFEDNLGHFTNTTPMYSGSSKGVLNTTPEHDSTTAYSGVASIKIQLIDNPLASDPWFIRFISGPPSASLATNDTLGATGWIGYALKVSGGSDSLMCGIGMDAPGTAEISDSLQVIRDDQWHLYQWELADSNVWHAWVVGNGVIEEPVSIDAIWFYAPDGTPDVTINMDYVAWNPTGVIPVELISFKADINGNNVELRWITATELNNSGFEIERKIANGVFEKLAFVDGNGTTTQANIYSYTDQVNNVGKYYYRLKQIDYDGTFEYSNEIMVEVIALPGQYALAQNYPNPFNPSTTIEFVIPQTGFVNLSVFNLLGEKVAELVNEVRESGNHTAVFDASNLSSGTYIYTLSVNGNLLTKKMTLIK